MEERYITDIHFKKSLNVLYPLLGFKQGEAPVKFDTFLYWEELDDCIDNYKIIVFYQTEHTDIFKKFEEESILTKTNLVGCYQVEDGFVYLFDMVSYAQDIGHFLNGEYSQINVNTKRKILGYFGNPDDKTVAPGRPVHMLLYPLLYLAKVSEELQVPVEDLTELASKFDIKEEILEKKIVEETCDCYKTTYYLS